MINEASIIPYTNNWKRQRVAPQHTSSFNAKNEFEMSLYWHLDMVRNDGGNIVEELDKMIAKYPRQKIDRDKFLNYFLQPIFE
jgi:hypothetical protein